MSEQSANNHAGDKPSPKSIRAQAFRMAFEMIAVFGIPATAALLLGQWLDDQIGFAALEYVLLAIAFISSWVIVFWRVKSFSKDLDSAEKSDKSNQK